MSKKHKERAKKSSLKKTAKAILEDIKLLAELTLLVLEILDLLKQQGGRLEKIQLSFRIAFFQAEVK